MKCSDPGLFPLGLLVSLALSGNPEQTATAPMAAKHKRRGEEDDSNKVSRAPCEPNDASDLRAGHVQSRVAPLRVHLAHKHQTDVNFYLNLTGGIPAKKMLARV